MPLSRLSRRWLFALVALALVGAGVGAWALWFRAKERASLSAGGGARVVAVSPDGALIAAAGEGGPVRVWDEHGGTKFTLEGHTGRVNGLAFAPDSKLIASCGDDRTIRLWDATTGAPGAVISTPEASAECVAFSFDGKAMATAGGDGLVRIWAVPSGKPVRVLKGHTKRVHAVAFVPHASTLASAGEDGGVRLWNWLTAEPLGVVPVEKHRVHALAASPDGKTMAAATGGGVRWWEVPGRGPRAKVNGSGGARAVAFDAGGRYLATAHEDGTVKLWAAADGAPVTTFEGHRGPVCGVGFAPDGKTLVSAGSDGTVKLWDVPAR